MGECTIYRHHRRSLALRCMLRRAILHPCLGLDGLLLLCFRFSFSSIHYLDYYMCRNHSFVQLLSACNEDYHWWWRSFANAGSTAIWVFLYSFVYFKQLEANSFTTYVLYFGYMGLASIGLFLMTGFIGVISTLYFNKTIFASVKVD